MSQFLKTSLWAGLGSCKIGIKLMSSSCYFREITANCSFIEVLHNRSMLSTQENYYTFSVSCD